MLTWILRIGILLLALRALVRFVSRQLAAPKPAPGPRFDPEGGNNREKPHAWRVSRHDEIADADYEDIPSERG